MKLVSRAKLRGCTLNEKCKKAQISKFEYGEDDNRCFCYGLTDCENDEYLDERKVCKAFAYNAEPLEEAKQ